MSHNPRVFGRKWEKKWEVYAQKKIMTRREIEPVPSAYMPKALTIWATEADTLPHALTFM